MPRVAARAFLAAVLAWSMAASETALELLERHCVKCHNADKAKADFDLSTREGLLKGGESGPATDLLIKSIRHEAEPHMPHKERKLSNDSIATIAAWLHSGAKYDRTLKPIDKPPAFELSEKDRAHWAFQPITKPALPKGSAAHPIDRFIQSKLRAARLKPSPEASRETLVRRVTFDLIGLPPTPAEIDAFLANKSPKAYEQLIDRLLASPHYGERWGRHWLDLARFAESDGFEHDAVRPHSWRYRDYVINSFNNDKPYDRFIREQLAGDELWPDEPEALVATAFNLLGPDMVDSSDQIQRRHNTLNDMTDTASLAFLGLTMGCARCHDHKFEPISQRDYYSFQAFFTSAKFLPDRDIPTAAERAAHDEAQRAYDNNESVKALRALESDARKKVFERKVSTLAPEAQIAHRTPVHERNAEQANLALETADKVLVTDKDLAAEFTGDAKKQRDELVAAVKRVLKPEPLPKSMALAAGKQVKTHVLTRGDYHNPADEVASAIPTVLQNGKAKSGSRAQLADWIASPENPLTARVFVNRVWQHHFGRALVATTSDFGVHGAKPTHPELLDWLAADFIENGCRIKRLHKQMLMSATYRQRSNLNESENQSYASMSRVRLEGEAVRDALLLISGELKTEMGGPGVYPPIPKELFAGATGWPAAKNPSATARRSVYIFARRNLRFPFLEVFDAPDNNLSCPGRERSTTAPQSLMLLNSDEVIRAAKLTAERIGNSDDKITAAYRLILGRKPSREETSMAAEFLDQAPLPEFCRALFNLNDFVYVQ